MKTKQFIFVLSIVLIAFSCKTVKKVATIQEAFTKKDTVQTVMIVDAPKVDSAAIVKDIMRKVVKSKIDFKTFNAKIKVGYESADNSDTYTVNISVLKDSLMYIRILGSFLGIKQEGMQVKVKRDSVFLYKKIGERYVQNRSISFLQEVTQIPFDFTTLQDLIIGNPVFIDSNIVSYKDNDAGLLVLMLGDTFKHLITLAQDDKTIIHSKLDDVDFQRNRTCDITYSSYAPLGSYQFSTYRRVVVSEKSKLDLELDFKEYTINEPLKYTFEIPKNVKRK
ncbi:MAG: DUF4292 domain-containing protein [Sediminibacterium sp.]|nr:DUF4292 domain-containing protein [Sediminibacterium sp.]MBX9780103.1 DUF4292 domain-containing protein [Chitinophagaceae bacterium]